MSAIFVDHLDGTNGTDLNPGVNCSYNQRGIAGTSTAQFDTSTSAGGVSSAKLVQTASFNSITFNTIPLGAGITTVYQRMCYRFGVLPNGNLYISQVLDSTGALVARLAVNSAGKLAVYNGTTLAATGTTTLSTNTWYRVEWDLVGTTTTVRLYTGPNSTTLVETITATITGTAFVRFVDGIPASSNSNLVTMWMDEIVRDSASSPGPVTGIPVSATGSLGFSGTSTSSQSVHATGSLGFSGTVQALTAGGKIAGLADSFAGTVVDTTKWVPKNGSTQNNGAIVPCSAAGSSFTSAQYWDGTASVVFVGISPPAAGSGDLTITLTNRSDSTKYVQVKVTGGNLSATVLDGVADPSPVSRAVTNRDNVVRFTEASGQVTIDVRERNKTTWSTLRTITTPSWWNTLIVALGGFASSSSAKAVFTTVNVAAAAPTGHAAASSVSDDFSGNSLSTRWTTSGPGTLTVAGEVDIAAVNTGVTQVTTIDSYVLDVASLLVKPAVASSGDTTTFKLLSPTPGTEARFTLTSGQIIAEYRLADVSDAYAVSVTHDNTQAVYLQFAADLLNNNLVWSYSLDGISYAVLRTSPLPVWYTGAQFAFATKAA